MEVFAALADPTRQRIVEMLAMADRDAGSIAAEFSVSRPAISRHLRVLRESGVVESRTAGQRRVYRLVPEALYEVEQWASRYRAFWQGRLDGLEEHLAKTRSTREETP